MTLEPLSDLDRSTLRERAREALRSAITSGQYQPGDHLGEVELATHLGVSRGTVREAMRHLQQEGLLTAGRRGMLRVTAWCEGGAGAVPGAGGAGEARRRRDHVVARARCRGGDVAGGAVGARRDRPRLRGAGRSRPGLPPAAVPLAGNSMLVEAWRYLEGRIRVAIMNCETGQRPADDGRRSACPDRRRDRARRPRGREAVIDQHMAEAADHFADAPAEQPTPPTAR